MKHEEIFNLAQDHGVCDDFGRWNFNDDSLVELVLTVIELEREKIANDVKAVLDKTSLEIWSDILEAK